MRDERGNGRIRVLGFLSSLSGGGEQSTLFGRGGGWGEDEIGAQISACENGEQITLFPCSFAGEQVRFSTLKIDHIKFYLAIVCGKCTKNQKLLNFRIGKHHCVWFKKKLGAKKSLIPRFVFMSDYKGL